MSALSKSWGLALWFWSGLAWAQSLPAQLVVAGGEPFVVGASSEVLLGQGYLGVEMIDLNPELRQFFGALDDVGVLVARVSQGSPADKAGLRVGDVVTFVDASPASAAWDLIRAVRPRSAGDLLSLEVVRDGSSKTVSVRIAEREREIVMVPTDQLALGSADREGVRALESALSRALGAYSDPSIAIGLQSPDQMDAMLQRMRAFEERIAQLESALRHAQSD
jgi:membrane-associated protease RseP (regulator of RpoE activity)